jgi:hypothetical protein
LPLIGGMSIRVSSRLVVLAAITGRGVGVGVVNLAGVGTVVSVGWAGVAADVAGVPVSTVGWLVRRGLGVVDRGVSGAPWAQAVSSKQSSRTSDPAGERTLDALMITHLAIAALAHG